MRLPPSRQFGLAGRPSGRAGNSLRRQTGFATMPSRPSLQAHQACSPVRGEHDSRSGGKATPAVAGMSLRTGSRPGRMFPTSRATPGLNVLTGRRVEGHEQPQPSSPHKPAPRCDGCVVEHRPINAFAEQKLDHTINLAWARDLYGPLCCTIRCRQTFRRLIDRREQVTGGRSAAGPDGSV
jgi:hypothetical protein